MKDNPSFRAPTPDEINELRADLVAAHAHIGHLHGLIFGATCPLPLGLMEAVLSWEDCQC
ncbi:hypothetical protein ACE02U_17915 [Shewanella xiamenensis]|uniref:hypothetical protein n=1 Tax=Shewanella xiamenensis TaxID=332186 RepID=UPI0035BA9494